MNNRSPKRSIWRFHGISVFILEIHLRRLPAVTGKMTINRKKRMTMRRLSTLCLCAALLSGAIASSCARTTEIEPGAQDRILPSAPPSDSISFTAYLTQETSKTQLGEDWNVLWSKGDRIKVYNAAHPEGVEFALVGDGGSTAGTFSGTAMGDGPYYAFFPADAAGTLTETALSVTFPATQSYAEGSFGPKANLAAGKADQLEGLCFHNLTGVLSLTLTGNKALREIKVCAYDEQPLHGTGVVDGWDDGTFALTLDEGQTGEDYRDVTLDCGEQGVPLDATTGTVFYLNVPAETLAGGYRIEVCDTEGKAMVKYAKAQAANRVDRSEIVQMPALEYVPAYKAGFLKSEEIGAFRFASVDGEMSPVCIYTEGESQYAYLNGTDTRYLRLEDWQQGYALGFTMPASLPAGKNVQVTIQSSGSLSIPSGTVSKMRVVKHAHGKVWMLDPSTGDGFILMMED